MDIEIKVSKTTDQITQEQAQKIRRMANILREAGLDTILTWGDAMINNKAHA